MRFKIISYLKVGYLFTVTELLFSFFLFYLLDIPSWGANDVTLIKIVALCLVVVLPLIAQLDARSRYQNYKLDKGSFIYSRI